ncbi:MAG: mevalonate kinase [Candidatus Aenigmatarchaeota archaeon]|nr:MAG: mevalonate kinase [Candidatus Aenigmarchaeota archaeon]
MMQTSAPGNIFLFGEHAVVYNRPGIISAIGLRTYCEIEKNEDSLINIYSEGYGEFSAKIENLKPVGNYAERIDLLCDLISTYYRKFKIKEGVTLKITSDIPKDSGGMSSSTAVLCSVLEGLNKIFQKVDKKDYYEFLLPFQKKIHGGNASGVELFSSTFGGYNKVRIGPVRCENLGELKLPILIADTEIEAKTSETVPYVRNGWEKDKNSYEDIFYRIRQLVEEGKKAIKNHDLVVLGNLMIKNHEILAKDLGVSHPKLNKMVEIALENGAYGAKLSGGGKGGAAIILVSKEKEDKIIEKLNFCKVYKTEIGVNGCK